ncbi:MAG: Ig-like domain-containing protein [Bacteroidota bacterium]
MEALRALTYRACDLGSACSTPATVTIVVTPVNDAPVAVNDVALTGVNQSYAGNVASNDYDPDNDPLTFSLIANVSHGTLSLSADGTFNYNPAVNYKGPDQFEYRVCDNHGLCDTAFVNISVSTANFPPVAVYDTYTVNEDQVLTRTALLGVLNNDTDPDGETLQATLVKNVTHGTLVLQTDGSFVYTPTANYFGGDTFIYKGCDPIAQCDTAIVYITVNPVNDAPVAVNDKKTTPEDVAFTYTAITDLVNSNDSDPDGDVLTITFNGTPKHGTHVNNNNGTYTYIPAPNYNGLDSIRYTVCDQGGLCASAWLVITVTPVNDVPTANPDAYSMAMNTQLNTTTADGVLFNDVDPDGVLTAALVSGTTKGALTLNANGSFSYKPITNFTGIDSFVYRACDPEGACANASVTINVLPVNQPPVAVDDYLSTLKNAPVSANVLSNDSDPDGNVLTASQLSNPIHGTLVFNPNGSMTYTPNVGYVGGDQFTYRVCDNGAPSKCANANVFVVVVDNGTGGPGTGGPGTGGPGTGGPGTGFPPPLAVRDTFDVMMDNALVKGKVDGVIRNDVYHDKNLLQATLINNSTKGSTYLNKDGSFTYIPISGFSGQDSFSYQICDTVGFCDRTTVLIRVIGVNRRPIPRDDFYSVFEDSVLVVNAPGFLGNDIDPDGDSLYVTIQTPAIHGQVVLLGNGAFRYTPFYNFNGLDNFSYQVCDGRTPNLCNNATVNITVIPVNDSLVAYRDFYVVQRNTAFTLSLPQSVLLNDVDIDNDILKARKVVDAQHGSLKIFDDGTLFYVPVTNYVGLDSALYEASDPFGLTDTAYVVFDVVIGTTNQAPIAQNDTINLLEDQSGSFTEQYVLSNDYDPEGDAFAFTLLTSPANGTLTDNGNQTFTYVPQPNYYGFDQVLYRICDGIGGCDTALIVFRVLSVNDKPVAMDDYYTTDQDTEFNDPAPSVTRNDTDVDNEPLNATLIGNGQHGQFSIDAAGGLKYIPYAGFFGVDSCYYQACDAGGLCDTALIQINVKETFRNAAPIPGDDYYTTKVNVELSKDAAQGVLWNDRDPDFNTLSAQKLSDPMNGAVSLNTDGSFTYRPNPGFIGVDVFTYNACDNGSPSICIPATVTITVIGEPVIGVAKTASVPMLQTDGSYNVNFTFVLKNYGTSDLTSVELNDDLAAAFPAPSTFSVSGPPVSGDVMTNWSFNGTTNKNLLASSVVLPTGKTATITMTVNIRLNGVDGRFENSAEARAISNGQQVIDRSQNGTDPDPDGDANPTNNNEPTPVVIADNKFLGLAKAVSQPIREQNGSYTMIYSVVVANYGILDMTSLSVVDNLSQTFTDAVSFSVIGKVTSHLGFTVNPRFDGVSSVNLYDGSITLAPGKTDTLKFKVNVIPGKGTNTYFNTAIGAAQYGNASISDQSTEGLVPDANNDGNVEDNVPTKVILNFMDIFVPGGFSPDGDGVNELFIIENANGRQIQLQMYNRWGNLVYESRDYQNDWSGTSNKGATIGQNLPGGTYYYVMEVEGMEPVVGFITINR